MNRHKELLILIAIVAVMAASLSPTGTSDSAPPVLGVTPVVERPVPEEPPVVNGFVLTLKRTDTQDLAKSKFRVELHNTSNERRPIPSSFCQGVPWSHPVKFAVSGEIGSWDMMYGFAEPECHEHEAHSVSIGPDARLTWDFTIPDLTGTTNNGHGNLDRALYEGNAGELTIQAFLPDGDGVIESNTLTVRQVPNLLRRLSGG
jgi:hypothetical protein